MLSEQNSRRIRRAIGECVSNAVQHGLEALREAAESAYTEAAVAMTKFSPFNSAHEGFDVLKEEVDELWEAIKSNDFEEAREEAVQVAAMALRYIAECPGSKAYGNAEEYRGEDKEPCIKN